MRRTQASALKRRRWDVALAACVAAAIGIVLVSESGYRQLARGYEDGIESVWTGVRLNELSAQLAEAETRQRSYLHTWNAEQIEPYERSVVVIRGLVDELGAHYAAGIDRQADQLFRGLVAAIAARLSEIELAVRLTQRAHPERVLQVADRDEARATMARIRLLVQQLTWRENELARTAADGWRSSLALSRVGIAGATILNVALLLVLFSGMKRDWRRAQHRQGLLDRLVRERTSQLGMLASRLQEAAEAEKAAMARELHDELGALLTASKMDLAWVRGRLGGEHAALQEKLGRVMQHLDQGLLVKRRIVEGLRPSALSTLGLAVAARQMAQQVAECAGWQLDLDLPERDLELSEDVEIALFRVLQESLTNAAKHARAARVRVRLAYHHGGCELEIEDDGIGFRPNEIGPSAQGLFGMRHRIEARSGIFELHSAPGAGTRVHARLPIEPRIAPAPAPRPSLQPLKIADA
ncbi:MAG: CHASE3 domain-containing protein [Burkholderiales bacterium]|nr:CHASE3 domain-containing protein [Burkholderiales bacterium]